MLKLVSLNVERSKHLDLIIPFLKEQQADVVCLQELCERDIPVFTEFLGKPVLYTPATSQFAEDEYKVEGDGIFSRLPIEQARVDYYNGDGSEVPVSDDRNSDTFTFCNRFVSTVEVKKDEEIFRISTTHFSWSPRGLASDKQRTDLASMISILETYGEFILAGDFNAPRGDEIFNALADKYKDNIPSQYLTSIDLDLHRAAIAGRRQEMEHKMVDGLFTTPSYMASDVQLISGVSDHCAIVATIAKV